MRSLRGRVTVNFSLAFRCIISIDAAQSINAFTGANPSVKSTLIGRAHHDGPQCKQSRLDLLPQLVSGRAYIDGPHLKEGPARFVWVLAAGIGHGEAVHFLLTLKDDIHSLLKGSFRRCPQI